MSDNTMLQTTKIILKSLLISSPKSVTIDQLNSDYRNQEGQFIPFSKLGHKSLTDFLVSIPDTLTVNIHTSIVKPVISKNSGSNHIHKLVSEQKSKKNNRSRQSNKSQRREQNMKPPFLPQPYQYNNHVMYQQQRCDQKKFEPGNLLQPPNSLYMDLLYKARMLNSMTNHERIPYSYSNNAQQLTEMKSSKQSYVSTSRPRKKRTNSCTSKANVTSINQLQNPANRKSDDSNCRLSESMLSLNLNTTVRHIERLKPLDNNAAIPNLEFDDPIHLIGKNSSPIYGDKISPAICEEIVIGGTYRISISEIVSPWKFWFHLHDSINLLEDLQFKLNSAYTERKYKTFMTNSHIKIGSAYVAFYKQNWLRAEVIAMLDNDNVKLYFVDFGTIDIVSLKNIQLLLADLCKMPALCHRAMLDFIIPFNDREMQRCITMQFCALVLNKSLFGIVSNPKECDNTIRMIVIDTQNVPRNVDLIINKKLIDLLVVEGVAKLSK